MTALPPDQLMLAARWVFWLWVAGLLARPLARRIFPDHADDGYVAGKLLGWVVAPFAAWWLASAGAISFAQSGPEAGVLALALLFAVFQTPGSLRLHRHDVALEALFVLLFVLGLAVRLRTPDLAGLEKFMDLGFMAAAMRADAMPPEDMWFAGAPVNYYYFGHAGAAFWALIAGARPDHGYQLHMASLFALTGLGLFRLGWELARRHGRRLAAVAGGVTAALALYAGNLHSVVYSVLRPWSGTTKPEFYYPDSTRFIGFDPPTDDKGFTEFASYGFAVGDMHAHILATPVAVLVLILLLSAFRAGWPEPRAPMLQAGVLGLLLGVSYMTNAWDLPILGLIAVLVAAALLIRHHAAGIAHLDSLTAAAILAGAVAFFAAAPFVSEFESFAHGLAAVDHRTPLWQLLLVYGHAAGAVIALGLLWIAAPAWRDVERSFALILGIGSIILIAIPEFLRVADIYGADFARANTMFKFSFRAQTLLQIVAVACIAHLAAGRRVALSTAFALSLPLIATFSYAEHTFRRPDRIGNLDGLRFLGGEAAMVAFMRDLPLASGESILEASGESYTDAGRVSATTGKPTPLGWRNHEWLWRNDPDAPMRREADVHLAYSGADPGPVCRIIARHSVRYIVIGETERTQYPELNIERLRRLGRPIFEDGVGTILAVDPATCAPR